MKKHSVRLVSIKMGNEKEVLHGYMIYGQCYDEVLIVLHTLDGWMINDMRHYCETLTPKDYGVFKWEGTVTITGKDRDAKFEGIVTCLNDKLL
jgi:hypothetical protein